MTRGVRNFSKQTFMKTVRRKFTNTAANQNQKMFPDEVQRGADRAASRLKRKAEKQCLTAGMDGKPGKKGKRSGGESPTDGERKTAQ
jgi:hypothetical protein